MKLVPAVIVINAGKYIKLNKFKGQLLQFNINVTRLIPEKNGYIAVVLETTEQAELCYQQLKQMNNYRDELYKCTLVDDYEVKQNNYKQKLDESEEELEDEAGNNQALQEQKTLVQVTSPFFGNDTELYIKQKSVRNPVSNQFRRLLKGQSLQSQYSVLKTQQLPKLMPDYLKHDKYRKLCLNMPPIIDGTVQYEYRSKGEFMLYINKDQSQFSLGSFYRLKGNDFVVFCADDMLQECKIFPKVALQLNKIIQTIFNENIIKLINLEEFINLNNFVVIKTSGEIENDLFVGKQVLVTFCFQDQQLQKIIEKQIENVSQQIKSTFFTLNNKQIEFTIQTDKQNNYITQQLYGLSFQIYNESFFQVNLDVQIKIFDYILNRIKTDVQQLNAIVDLCCGSGVIGQVLLKELQQHYQSKIELVGIDIVPEAIQAAQQSLAYNKLEAEYICGDVEQHCEIFAKYQNTVAILDPPRSGLHKNVLQTIRNSQIQYIAYISCNPKSLTNDLYALCAIDCEYVKKQPVYRTAPFYISDIMLFNMFRYCDHVETVIILKRCSDMHGEVQEQ